MSNSHVLLLVFIIISMAHEGTMSPCTNSFPRCGPLQCRGCSAMAATSSRARGTWTWAAPTPRSSPALTPTKASNTASASGQRAVSTLMRALIHAVFIEQVIPSKATHERYKVPKNGKWTAFMQCFSHQWPLKALYNIASHSPFHEPIRRATDSSSGSTLC